MRRRTVTATSSTTATPSEVWALLADRPSWPDWSALGRYEPGQGVEGTVGSTCTFVTGRIRSEERLAAVDPERHLAYELLSGLPMVGYRGEVDLVPTGDGGTRITWQSSFAPRWPGTGWAFQLMMNKVLNDMAGALARASVRG